MSENDSGTTVEARSVETIEAVGSQRAQTLEDAGIETVDDIVDEGVESLTELKGFGDTLARSVATEAEEMTSDDEDAWNGVENVVIIAQDGFEDVATKEAIFRIEEAVQNSPYAPRVVGRSQVGMYGGELVQEWASMRSLHDVSSPNVQPFGTDWETKEAGEAIEERDTEMARWADAALVVEDGDYKEYTMRRFEEWGCEVFEHIEPKYETDGFEELTHEGSREKVAVVYGRDDTALLDDEKRVSLVDEALDEAGLEPGVIGMQNNMDSDSGPVELWNEKEDDVPRRVFHAPWNEFSDSNKGEAAKCRDAAMCAWADSVVVVRPGEYTDLLLDRGRGAADTYKYTVTDGLEARPVVEVGSSDGSKKGADVRMDIPDDLDDMWDEMGHQGPMDERGGWEDYEDGEGAGSHGGFTSN